MFILSLVIKNMYAIYVHVVFIKYMYIVPSHFEIFQI